MPKHDRRIDADDTTARQHCHDIIMECLAKGMDGSPLVVDGAYSRGMKAAMALSVLVSFHNEARWRRGLRRCP